MLAVLSPAKSLDLETPVPAVAATQPAFLADAAKLAKRATKLKAADLRVLMHISDPLAALNVARFKAFHTPFTPENARPALYTFHGDVYRGLDGPTLDEAAVTFAQHHVRFLSGLYGALRPLDLIQPYRLEMGIKLATSRQSDLYGYWGDRVTDALAAALDGHADQTLVNLASVEYFGVVRPERLPAGVLTIDFRDEHDGELKFNSFAAKRARGLMARYICVERINAKDALRGFDYENYRFRSEPSSDTHWTFVRQITGKRRQSSPSAPVIRKGPGVAARPS